jgi:predicted N-acetyltransferase YhbS
MTNTIIRTALPEDAAAASAVLRAAFEGEHELFSEPATLTPGTFEVVLQTGHRVLVAEAGGQVVGVVRLWDEDGMGWFDWLASAAPWAGRALLRAVEIEAQDRGIRLVRANIPEGGALQDYFERFGYRPIARITAGGRTLVTVERRLPLLTVREQRRADADAIGEIAGIDPWPLAQENRGGWFVLSDGERVVGVISVRDGGSGLALLAEPVLLHEYRGRHLELWMIERATTYAETRGFHTAEIAQSPALNALKRDLEDRRWFPEAKLYRKSLGDAPRTAIGDWSTGDD